MNMYINKCVYRYIVWSIKKQLKIFYSYFIKKIKCHEKTCKQCFFFSVYQSIFRFE